MIKISKKMLLITVLLLTISAAAYTAGSCLYTCVFCGMEVFSGCGNPPSSNGYCPNSPKTHQHVFVLTKKY